MANNKVILNGETLIDLTEDTVTEDTLLEGETAHDARGKAIRGRAKTGASEWDEINNKPFSGVSTDDFKVEADTLKLSNRVTGEISTLTTKVADNEDNGFLDGGNLAKLEQGSIDLSNGKETASTTRCRTNYIPIVPNVEYYTDQTNWSIRNGCIYDANMNFISYNAFPDANGKFITEVSNARYLRLIYSHNNTSENCYPTDYPYQFNKDSLKKYHPYAESNVTLTSKIDYNENEGFLDTTLVSVNDLSREYYQYSSGNLITNNANYIGIPKKIPIKNGDKIIIDIETSLSNPWIGCALFNSDGSYYKIGAGDYLKHKEITADKDGFFALSFYSTNINISDIKKLTVYINNVCKSNVQLTNEIANLGDEWNSTKAYKVGEFTIYNNTLWKCKANNTNVTPTNGTYWRACKIATELSHEIIDTQSMETAPNSVNDFTFNFTQTYDEVPFVTITRKDKSTGTYYGNVEVTMNDITRTYVKIHVYNTSDKTVYPTCNLLITRV